MIDEEESKRLRIYNREKRLELQLIIERCNEVDFEYVCLPNVRNESDLCFGSRHPRKLVLMCGKDVDSFMAQASTIPASHPKTSINLTLAVGESSVRRMKSSAHQKRTSQNVIYARSYHVTSTGGT